MAAMTKRRGLGISAVVISVWELVERADFVRSHLPKWVVTHSDPWIIALLLVIVLLFAFGDQHSEESGQPARQTNRNESSGNATATGGTAVAKIAETIYLSTQPDLRPVPLPPQPKPERKPRIVVVTTRTIWVTNQGNYFQETQNHLGGYQVQALVAVLRNEPNNNTCLSHWHRVLASITFYDANLEEVANVGRGSWLLNSSPWIDMDQFQDCSLVFAVKERDNWKVEGGAELKSLDERAATAKVVLHDERSERLTLPLFDIDLKEGRIAKRQ